MKPSIIFEKNRQGLYGGSRRSGFCDGGEHYIYDF